MNIFIHHKDLRLNDNTSLIKLIQNMDEEKILPIFIFTPEQIDPKKNKYYSSNFVQFMCENLVDLSEQYNSFGGKLQFFEGNYLDILEKIKNHLSKKKITINNIAFNIDYSPYALKRDKEISDWCHKNKINVISEEDQLLVNIVNGQTKADSTNNAYQVFTPFMKNLKEKFKISNEDKFNKFKGSFYNKSLNTKEQIDEKNLTKFYKVNPNLNVKSGKKEAIKKLNKLKNQKKYTDMRNCMNYETSYLSAYINLGLVSIRQVYQKAVSELGKNSGLITELYWRDFYYNIMYFFPHIVGHSFREKYDNIKWKNSKKDFKKWCDGETGFPIVDACMRQMNTSGYMHNRGRMIVSSFLTKDLLIDWRWGEKYFAQNLQDYSISANNGGWQWASGSGTDAQPYFRIFNPWTQSKNYDPNCEYIKKWIPELEDVENKHIHQWYKFFEEYESDYPEPMVDHDKARKETLEVFKKYL